MLKPQGYGVFVDPQQGQPLAERDTCSCGHCNAVIFVKPGSATTVYLLQHLDPVTRQITWTEEPGAFCRVCMRAVCLRCHDVGTCTPLEAFLEQMESGRVRRPSVSLAGLAVR